MTVLLTRLKELYYKRGSLKSLVIKSLTNRYIGSRLGFGWSVLNPILLALVISFVFTNIFRTDKPNFTCFVLSGILPWFFFSSSLNESAASILSGSSLLNQFPIQREMFPIATVYSNFLILLSGLGILLPFFILVDLNILSTIIYLPFLLAVYFIFTLGISFITSSLNIIFRDLAHILNIGLMLWMWVTPIFYSADSVPFPYNKILLLNPVFPFIYLFNALLYKNDVFIGLYFLWSFLSAVFSFFIGYTLFLKLEGRFIKKM